LSSKVLVDELAGKTAAGNITITSEGGAATMQLQQGVAKAWVDFNGTGTVSVDDSFNISSADDNGTGYYQFNYTSSMSSTAYCPQATGRGDSTNEGAWCSSTRVPATSDCEIRYFQNSTGNAQDQTALSWSNLGDLA
jgi:hypothetical protein